MRERKTLEKNFFDKLKNNACNFVKSVYNK